MGHVNVVINDILRDINGGKGFAQGGQFGPSFDTALTRLANGSEIRTQRREPIRRYSLSRNVLKSVAASDSWPKFLSFLYQLRGAETSFLIEDPSDCSTFPDHLTNPASFSGTWPTNPRLSSGFTAGQAVQLVKRYEATDQLPAYERVISRPQSGTVRVYWDDVMKFEGPDFTVDYDTGIITLVTAPAEPGPVLYADCKYHVPVRFGQQTDEWLQAAVGTGPEDIASLPNLEFEEVLNFGQGTESRFYGGARELTMPSSQQLSIHDAAFQSVNATAGSLSLTLPNANPTGALDQAPLPLGGPYFTIENAGSNAFDIKDGAITRKTLAAGEWAQVFAVTATPGPRAWLVVS